MKIDWTTIVLMLSAAVTAGSDKITEATQWGDLLKPMPIFSMVAPALVTLVAHAILKRPVDKWDGLTERRGDRD